MVPVMVAGNPSRVGHSRWPQSARRCDVDSTIVAALLDTAQILAQPNPDPVAPPGMDDVAEQFLGWGKWILLIAGVLGMFICAGMMIIGRRNRSATAVDGAAGVPWVLGGLFLAAVAASIVGAVL